jgi:hypothetical protein
MKKTKPIKDVILTLRVTQELYDILQKESAASGLPVGWIIRRLCEEKFKTCFKK